MLDAKSQFMFFLLFAAVFLQLLAMRYVGTNDLKVYEEALLDGGVYAGDWAFEKLQLGLVFLLGPQLTIYGMQLVLVFLIVIFVYQIRRKTYSFSYIAALVILTSPLVLVGLTNSIRQSLAFALILISFESRHALTKYGLLIIAVLTHTASLVLILVVWITLLAINFRRFSIPRRHLMRILVLSFLCVLFVLWRIVEISNFFVSVYERYEVYLYSAVTFTDGRVGVLKVYAWIAFWIVLLSFDARCHRARVSLFLVMPLLFTFLIFFDASLRGFDEFHSRLLLMNNPLLLLWFSQTIKIGEERMWYPFLLVYNFFNPSTLGVLT